MIQLETPILLSNGKPVLVEVVSRAHQQFDIILKGKNIVLGSVWIELNDGALLVNKMYLSSAPYQQISTALHELVFRLALLNHCSNNIQIRSSSDSIIHHFLNGYRVVDGQAHIQPYQDYESPYYQEFLSLYERTQSGEQGLEEQIERHPFYATYEMIAHTQFNLYRELFPDMSYKSFEDLSLTEKFLVAPMSLNVNTALQREIDVSYLKGASPTVKGKNLYDGLFMKLPEKEVQLLEVHYQQPKELIKPPLSDIPVDALSLAEVVTSHRLTEKAEVKEDDKPQEKKELDVHKDIPQENVLERPYYHETSLIKKINHLEEKLDKFEKRMDEKLLSLKDCFLKAFENHQEQRKNKEKSEKRRPISDRQKPHLEDFKDYLGPMFPYREKRIKR